MGGSADAVVVGMELLPNGMVASDIQRRGTRRRRQPVAATWTEGDVGKQVERDPLHGVGIRGRLHVRIDKGNCWGGH